MDHSVSQTKHLHKACITDSMEKDARDLIDCSHRNINDQSAYETIQTSRYRTCLHHNKLQAKKFGKKRSKDHRRMTGRRRWHLAIGSFGGQEIGQATGIGAVPINPSSDRNKRSGLARCWPPATYLRSRS